MRNLQSIQNYLGTASETKPASVNAGSTFRETDTKNEFTYDGSTWQRSDISPYPYKQSIAEGHRSNHIAWSKWGFNPTVTGTPTTIWGASVEYVFPTSASGMEIASTATSDTSDGAGARTVHVHYLNSSFEEKVETITMNGTSVVPTASMDFYRVNYFEIVTAGSTGTAIGDIDVRHLDNTPVYSRILAGHTRARTLVYTVPKDKNLFIDNANISAVHTAANKYSLMTLRSNYDRLCSASSALFYPEITILHDNGAFDLPMDISLKFAEGTDLKMCASSNGTAAISIGLRGWTEDA